MCWAAKCLLLDRDGKPLGDGGDAQAATDAWRAAREAARVTVTIEDQKVTACTGGAARCASVTAAALPTVAAASTTLKRLTAFDRDFIDTFDPKSGGLLSHVPATEATRTATEARYVGDTRLLVRAAGQWSVLDPTSGATLPVGPRGADAVPIDATTAAVFHAGKVEVVDAAAQKVTGVFTLPGTIADVMPWFDRIFVVLDHPAGTAQIDPRSATVYAGPALPKCP